MIAITPYLNFSGNCREAMEFYARALGGELWKMTFGESPMESPEEAKDLILHASVMVKGAPVVMASDTPPGMVLEAGNNVSLAVKCESAGEAERLFAALSEGGVVTMPLQETFWAERFGMLKDRFGVQWMLNLDKPSEG